MSYELQALIGKTPYLPDARTGLIAIRLNDDFWLAPLTSKIRDRYGIPHIPFDDCDCEELPASLVSLCSTLSQRCTIAYVEAAFWGGTGIQASVVFKDGVAIDKPVVDLHAINRALKVLGVTVGNEHDEFAALGLGRFRDTDKWVSTQMS